MSKEPEEVDGELRTIIATDSPESVVAEMIDQQKREELAERLRSITNTTRPS